LFQSGRAERNAGDKTEIPPYGDVSHGCVALASSWSQPRRIGCGFKHETEITSPNTALFMVAVEMNKPTGCRRRDHQPTDLNPKAETQSRTSGRIHLSKRSSLSCETSTGGKHDSTTTR